MLACPCENDYKYSAFSSFHHSVLTHSKKNIFTATTTSTSGDQHGTEINTYTIRDQHVRRSEIRAVNVRPKNQRQQSPPMASLRAEVRIKTFKFEFVTLSHEKNTRK